MSIDVATDAATELGKVRKPRLASMVWVVSLQILTIAVIAVIWEAATDSGSLNKFLFSKPSDIWVVIRDWATNGVLWTNTWATLQVLITGWLSGVVLGSAIGVLIGLSRNARDYLEPFLVFCNAVPRLLLAPIFVVLFGFGDGPKVLTVFLVIVFIVALTVESGVREIDVDVILNARTLGANRFNLVRTVYVPAVAVWVMSSARTTVGFAFQATIAAEFFASRDGLGRLVVTGENKLDSAEIFAALTIMLFLGVLIDYAVGFVQRRALRWNAPAR